MANVLKSSGIVTLAVDGVPGPSCDARIEDLVSKIPGVSCVTVVVPSAVVMVQFDVSLASKEVIVDAIHAMGYQVEVRKHDQLSESDRYQPGGNRDSVVVDEEEDIGKAMLVEEVELVIDGMSCASCAMRIENGLLSCSREGESGAGCAGVLRVSVDSVSKRAVVQYDATRTSPEKVKSAIGSLGYEVQIVAHRVSDLSPAQVILSLPTSRNTLPPLQSRGIAPSTVVVDTNVDRSECHVVYLVEGMSCSSCAARIEQSLENMMGVGSATVNFATQQAKITFDSLVVSPAKIASHIVGMGYSVQQHSLVGDRMGSGEGKADVAGAAPISDSLTLLIEGMSCASCAGRIETAIGDVRGVLHCCVNFSTCTAVVQLSKDEKSANVSQDIMDTIAQLGYSATLFDSSRSITALENTRRALERTKEIEDHRRRFFSSLALCIPLAVVMVLMSTTNLLHDPTTMMVVDSIQFVVTTPIVLIFGRSFFTRAWQSLSHGTFTMDTLVAIGTGISYGYSVAVFYAAIIGKEHITSYFDTAGMLMTFMLLGRYLEASAKRRTSSALIELMNLVPPVATLVTPDGDTTIPSSMVTKGSRLRVLPGDRIPVDGVVLEGTSDVDEQMVTGESLPKHIQPGANVVGGTLNVTAMIIIEADKVGEETMLSQILRIVQEAQTSKPAIQRIADRIAMYFVPCVIAISVVVFFTWLVLGALDMYPAEWRRGETHVLFALDFFIATIVAACPCALGLATPTAIMVGTGVGAHCGVLVKAGTTLESVRKADCFVFDKTGTITNGRLDGVAEDIFDGPVSEELARKLIGLAERQSNHPVAKAVAAYAFRDGAESRNGFRGTGEEKEQDLPIRIEEAVTHSGLGVEATIAQNSASGAETSRFMVLVGSLAMMQQFNVSVPTALRETVAERSMSGYTTVVGAINGAAMMIVSLADDIKPEASSVIRHLQHRGKRVLMVTGDNAGVAALVSRAVGLSPTEDVYAEVLPATKAAIVRELQESGLRVVFVGDGINDSPALAQANVGVALGAGTEVAIEAADAVLVSNSLVDLLNLVRLSEMTVRRIYGNFVWASGYNLVMLPMASGVLFPLLHFKLPPMAAGAAMMLSSLSVLMSSISIRCFQPWITEDFTSGGIGVGVAARGERTA